ncbi:type II toxin-antitoxin system HigB family toxin [Synechococcus moorigangaii CMS01]|nr:type II toxin-antitoxin system HigB family toxin [Synechococcus moorigangaii CMS01]
MRIIAKKTLTDFIAHNPQYFDAKEALEAWHSEAKAAKWQNPVDIKTQYRNASILKDNRVVFNIAGNKYRLIVAINFSAQIIFIKFIGTHKEYDKIDANTVELNNKND